MNKLVLLLTTVFLVGCSTIKYIPTQEKIITHQIDSIVYHDSIIYHNIYTEHYKEYAGPKDTLKLETAYSEFKAWNDTTFNVLKGVADNKIKDIPVKIKWKEKIVYKDSIITKEVPVPVEIIKEVKHIPTFFWITFGFSIIVLIYFALKLYFKFIK